MITSDSTSHPNSLSSIFSNLMAYLKNNKLNLILFIILPLLVILWRLPLSEKPLDDDSAANAYGARLILQGEPLYTSYHPGHHLPAIYYIYALAFALVGDSPAAIRFFLSLWLIPTAYLLYHISRAFADKKTGWLAVIFFLLLTSDYALEGHSAEIEQFANLPRIGAILLLITLLNRNSKEWQFIWLGLLGAICLLFKAVYISPLALTGLALLGQFWPRRNEPGAAGQLIRRISWVGAGLVVGFLPVVAYFGALGLLPRLGLVFTLGQRHVSLATVEVLFILLFPIIGLAIANLPLLTLGLSGAMLMPLNKLLPALSRCLIPLWLLLSLAEAGGSRHAFPHYYLLITPPLSLLAAWLVMQSYQLAQVKPRFKAAAWTTPALLLLAISGVYFFINGGYLKHYFTYKTGQETYRDFVLNSWPTTGEMFVALQDIAGYVQIHSKPDDRIYIWSDEVQLYYLTNRRCALDFIWTIYLENPAVPGTLADRQRRLFAPTTKFIVIAQDNPPPWLTAGLAQDYQLVKTIRDREIYQRLPD